MSADMPPEYDVTRTMLGAQAQAPNFKRSGLNIRTSRQLLGHMATNIPTMLQD